MTDAQQLARVLVNQSSDRTLMSALAEQTAWPPRRLNPAASYLVDTGNAVGQAALGSAPFWYREVRRTASTKRLVRDLDRA